MSPKASFEHVFLDQGQARTLFLLHGTGGSESDLIPLVEPFKDRFNIVGLRGNVSEGGLARFFARAAPGVFDPESIQRETEKLADFLAGWYAEHAMSAKQAAFVGYSNGANMVLATLLRHPEAVQAAALMHPMMPLEPPRELNLAGKRFLVTYGLRDAIVPEGEAERVAAALKAGGAEVEMFGHHGGHEVTQDEVDALHGFLNSL